MAIILSFIDVIIDLLGMGNKSNLWLFLILLVSLIPVEEVQEDPWDSYRLKAGRKKQKEERGILKYLAERKRKRQLKELRGRRRRLRN